MREPECRKRRVRPPLRWGTLPDRLACDKQISASFCGHITSLRDMSDPESRKRCAREPCGALLDQLVSDN